MCLSHRSRRASISRSSLAHVRSHSRQPPSVGHHRLPRSHRVRQSSRQCHAMDLPTYSQTTHSPLLPSVLPPASPSPPQPLRHKWVGPVPPVDHRALAQVQHECAVCHGTGKIIHRHCHKCGGDKERRRRVPPRPPLPARAGALLCTSGSSCEDGRIGAIRSCRRPREHATDGWARARSCSQYSRLLSQARSWPRNVRA